MNSGRDASVFDSSSTAERRESEPVLVVDEAGEGGYSVVYVSCDRERKSASPSASSLITVVVVAAALDAAPTPDKGDGSRSSIEHPTWLSNHQVISARTRLCAASVVVGEGGSPESSRAK